MGAGAGASVYLYSSVSVQSVLAAGTKAVASREQRPAYRLKWQGSACYETALTRVNGWVAT